ncbi:MAG TPA: hypothetical protein VMH61_07005 [Candidatus Acidoferrales bacterium]|nr:hypothetical protein [Candidatus Acidoferrales bacterium]
MRLRLLTLAMLLVPALAHAAPSRPGVAHRVRPAAARASAAAVRTGAPGRRTLDDIRIEGEIPVPQVLFITAREQRRFLEFQHRRYLRSARELSEATPDPSRIVVVHPPTPQQESAR